jgi:arylsulfatase A-like enzyme
MRERACSMSWNVITRVQYTIASAAAMFVGKKQMTEEEPQSSLTSHFAPSSTSQRRKNFTFVKFRALAAMRPRAVLLCSAMNLRSLGALRPAPLTLAPLLHATEKRPNILWLVAEDMFPDLACYGAKQVSSPNLDKLAAEGMRFTRCFSTAPVCSSSRSAFMTGMYQITIGAHHHRSHRDDGFMLPDGVKVIADRMREAGYFTANLINLPPSCGFKGTGKTDWNFTYEGKPFDSANYDDLKSHQPFFAQINFRETHRKYNAPKLADPDKVDVPPIYPDHPVTRKDWAQYLDSATELDRKIGLLLKQLEADALADDTIVVFMGDHGKSHVRGKQFCYDDGLSIPLIIRWAKNFPAPARFKAGTVSDQLIEAIDLAPTYLAIAGVPKPANVQGRVLFGDRAEPPREFAHGARDRCDETMFRLRTVRDARYRYIKNFMPERPFLQANDYKERSYPVWNLIKELGAQGKLTEWQKNFYLAPHMPEEELYDTVTDPWEMNNLVRSAKPEDQAALKCLRAELEKWLVEADDQGRFPEPPEVTAAKGATKPGTDPSTGVRLSLMIVFTSSTLGLSAWRRLKARSCRVKAKVFPAASRISVIWLAGAPLIAFSESSISL